eukprot:TRINITY_DN2521_c0_g5_i1.p1 TRINITY_DN2521_c0_g5~~TRINITY_DN2521_c0_g5_i1.p1  ORF type:complete len:141 (+),score=21.90 TRINITY_DN2521_c0_g5_i1:36-425(+)
MSVLDAALEVFADVNMQQIREKSEALSELFIAIVEAEVALSDLVLVSPRATKDRGSQLAFEHEHAHGICQALIELGVIADFRAPNILRFGFTPLYLRYQDILTSVQILTQVIQQKVYLQAQYNKQNKVT